MIKPTISDLLSGVTNWTAIQNKLVEINNIDSKLAGSLFEEFSYLFFKLEPSVFPEYQNVWLEKDIPSNVRTELVLANTDHGADLVLQHKDGSYHVVQCKFKNDSSHILGWTSDKLSSALAEADHSDGLVIFTNVADVADHVREKAKHKHFQLFAWQDMVELSSEFFKQAEEYSNGKKEVVRDFYTPLRHQELSINKTIEGFNTANRGQLILPCGAGKTLASLWIMEKLNADKTLVALPSLALLRQFRKDWLAQQKDWVPNICICSDEKVTKETADKALTRTDELRAPVTTDSNKIKKFLNDNKKCIVYSTYQSIPMLSEALKGTDLAFDFAVCDEAHKTAGFQGKTFRMIHDDKNVLIKKRLYMTATPRVLSEAVKGRLNDEELKLVFDMSDSKVFGNEFYRMSFAEAIKNDVLVDYKIIAIGVTDDEIKKNLDTKAFIQEGGTVDELANNYALQKVMKKYKAGHAVTFHSKVTKAENFKDRHQKLFPNTSLTYIPISLPIINRVQPFRLVQIPLALRLPGYCAA